MPAVGTGGTFLQDERGHAWLYPDACRIQLHLDDTIDLERAPNNRGCEREELKIQKRELFPVHPLHTLVVISSVTVIAVGDST